jgi:hypothetical protein
MDTNDSPGIYGTLVVLCECRGTANVSALPKKNLRFAGGEIRAVAVRPKVDHGVEDVKRREIRARLPLPILTDSDGDGGLLLADGLVASIAGDLNCVGMLCLTGRGLNPER